MEAEDTAVRTKKSKPRRKTPNWGVWEQRQNCHLADAVALSLNIHPGALASLEKGAQPGYSTYLTRLKTSSLSTSEKGPIKEIVDHPERGDDPYYRIVSLASFVAFAEKQEKWREKLPPEFLQLGTARNCEQPQPGGENGGSTALPPISNQVTITLPHTTKILEAVFQVMREQWSNVDPDRQPKQTVLAQMIDEALGVTPNKNGTPSRRAQEFAAAIRPDNIRDADRRANKRKD